MPRLILIAAIWSFIAAPALCRAGALTACCAQDDAAAATPACCSGDEQTPCEAPATPNEPPRECGACADVCKGIVKPDELRRLPGFDTHAQPWLVLFAPGSQIPSGGTLRAAFDRLSDSPHYHFPAAGFPLRI